MQLPGPVRAVVGLVASAADEARRLPDRAIELPMLAVSTALQASLRAQQRYARLAARGDAVINRRPVTEEPPPWATFDAPLSAEELQGAGLADPDPALRARAASELLDRLLADSASDGGAPSTSDADEPEDTAGDSGAPANVVDMPSRSRARRSSGSSGVGGEAARKSQPAKKATASRQTSTGRPARPVAKPGSSSAKGGSSADGSAKGGSARGGPARGGSGAGGSGAGGSGTRGSGAGGSGAGGGRGGESSKSISPPRHTAPSRFDTVDPDADGDT